MPFEGMCQSLHLDTCALNFKGAESRLTVGKVAGLNGHLEMVELHVCIQTWRSEAPTLCNVKQVRRQKKCDVLRPVFMNQAPRLLLL